MYNSCQLSNVIIILPRYGVPVSDYYVHAGYGFVVILIFQKQLHLVYRSLQCICLHLNYPNLHPDFPPVNDKDKLSKEAKKGTQKENVNKGDNHKKKDSYSFSVPLAVRQTCKIHNILCK